MPSTPLRVQASVLMKCHTFNVCLIISPWFYVTPSCPLWISCELWKCVFLDWDWTFIVGSFILGHLGRHRVRVLFHLSAWRQIISKFVFFFFLAFVFVFCGLLIRHFVNIWSPNTPLSFGSKHVMMAFYNGDCKIGVFPILLFHLHLLVFFFKKNFPSFLFSLPPTTSF